MNRGSVILGMNRGSVMLGMNRGIPDQTTIAVSMNPILLKLRQRRQDHSEALNAREAELQKANDQIEENKEMLDKLMMEEPNTKERFQLYQDMRAYIKDLLECLSEKVSIFRKIKNEVRKKERS
ncbi:unnamed protein product [Gongylonema pulchrum]|uniref:Uncharacterized protein n=1 Tax=Gongylonema pulchrum TaxID=637853 RepID=A0A183DHX8_9BILA|nr:unnamed protein product [Gongylonema pulchrum]